MFPDKFTRFAARHQRRLLNWMVSHPFTSLLAAIVLTASFILAAMQLEIRTNLEDLFPESTPNVLRAKEAREKLSLASQILLVVTSPDADANKRFVNDLVGKLSEDPSVNSIEYRHDMEFFKKNALLYLSREEIDELDEKLARAIRKGVEEELDPFADDEEGQEGGEAGSSRGSAPAGREADGADMDEDFSYEEGGNKGGERASGAQTGTDKAGEELDEDFAYEEGGDKEGAKAVAQSTMSTAEEREEEGLRLPDENEIRKKYNISSLSEYISNPEGTIMAMKVFPSFPPGDVAKSKQFIARIESIISQLDPESYSREMEWAMEGDYHSKIEQIDVINKDLSKASIVALIIILIIIGAYFQKPRAVIFVFVPLLSGLAWTMGMAWITVGYLNLITAFIFAIMFGLGVDFAVHATSRYLEERQGGKSPSEAVVEALMNLGHPMIAAAVTTTMSFLCLIVFQFRGFSQFGLIAGLGVPLCLLVVYLFLPPLAVLLDRLFKEKIVARPVSSMGRVRLFGGRRRNLMIYASVVLAAALFATGIPGVVFESDMSKVMSRSKEDKRSDVMRKYRRQVEARSTSPVVLLTGSIEETGQVHGHLKAKQPEMKYLQDFASIFSFVPEEQESKAAVIAGMERRLSRKMNALKGQEKEDAVKAMDYLHPQVFGVEDLPDWVKDRFTDKEGGLGRFVLLFAHGNKTDAKVVSEIVDQLGSIEVDGKTYHTTASYYVLKDAYDIVLEEGPIALALAGLLVLLFVGLDFRRWRPVVVSYLPLVLGVICFVGFLGITGNRINMFNMLVLPTMFGMGIDTAIHLVYRIKQEGAENVGLVANTTGTASGLSAATTAVGFGSLMLASHPGLESIGVLAPIGIIFCWLASLLATCSLSYLLDNGSGPQVDRKLDEVEPQEVKG